jgi:hypothetical protein
MCRIALFSSGFCDDDRRHCGTASRCVRHQPVSATSLDDEDFDLLRDGFTANRATVESDLPVMSLRVIPATDTRVMIVCHAPRCHTAVQPAALFGHPTCPTNDYAETFRLLHLILNSV